MMRIVGLMIAAVLILATCATAPDDGESERGVTDESIVGADVVAPLSVGPGFSEPGSDRVSIANVVLPVPAGWNVFRAIGDGESVRGTVRASVGDNEVVVGSFPVGHDVDPAALVAFAAAELFLADPVPPGDYIQIFENGSFYAGVPLDTSGETLRLRVFRDAAAFRYVGAVVQAIDETPDGAAVSEILAGARLSREGESVYRLRTDGISMLEIGGSDWFFLDDRENGITAGYEGDSVQFLARVSSRESVGRGGAKIPLWFGTERVMATVTTGRDAEWSVERISITHPSPITIELFHRGDDQPQRLFQTPEVQTLLRDNLWLEVAQ